MNKVFIVHGFQDSPNGGWRPWLMEELKRSGIYACALPMPDPNNPILTEWVQEITRTVERSSRDKIYLVGHSLGVPAILRFLETTNYKNVEGIVLVSGPFFKTSKKKVAQFLLKPFNCEGIKSKVKKIVVIHGSNDKSVSVNQGKALASALDARFIVIKNGGHLNESSSCFNLPQCLVSLKEMMGYSGV